MKKRKQKARRKMGFDPLRSVSGDLALFYRENIDSPIMRFILANARKKGRKYP